MFTNQQLLSLIFGIWNDYGEDFVLINRLVNKLRNGKNIFILPDSSFGVEEVLSILKSLGLFRHISVCESLGYLEERIIRGTTANPPRTESRMYCIVISN